MKDKSLLLLLLVVIACWLYLSLINDSIDSGDFESNPALTRLIIPDTVYYLSLSRDLNSISALFGSGSKNVVGPVVLWKIVDGNWYLMVVLNALMIWLSLYYFRNIIVQSGVDIRLVKNRDYLLIAILPATLIYMMGSLKEIPTLLLITAFFYYSLRHKYWAMIVCFGLSVLFRFQLAIPLGIYLVVKMFFSEKFLAGFLIMVLVCCVYPLLGSLNIFASSATQAYRLESGGGIGIGQLVEYVRDNIPILSFGAVLFRVMQNMFEYIIAFLTNPGIMIESGKLSVLVIAYVVSNIVLLPIWFQFIRSVMSRLAGTAQSVNRGFMDDALLFAVLFVIPVGGFSFIHQRYLYPILLIVIAIGIVDKIERQQREKI